MTDEIAGLTVHTTTTPIHVPEKTPAHATVFDPTEPRTYAYSMDVQNGKCCKITTSSAPEFTPRNTTISLVRPAYTYQETLDDNTPPQYLTLTYYVTAKQKREFFTGTARIQPNGPLSTTTAVYIIKYEQYMINSFTLISGIKELACIDANVCQITLQNDSTLYYPLEYVVYPETASLSPPNHINPMGARVTQPPGNTRQCDTITLAHTTNPPGITCLQYNTDHTEHSLTQYAESTQLIRAFDRPPTEETAIQQKFALLYPTQQQTPSTLAFAACAAILRQTPRIVDRTPAYVLHVCTLYRPQIQPDRICATCNKRIDPGMERACVQYTPVPLHGAYTIAYN
jgi:hypothetical protein